MCLRSKNILINVISTQYVGGEKMLSQDAKTICTVIDANKLFETLINLDEPQKILVSGFIQGLAAKESIENSKNPLSQLR